LIFISLLFIAFTYIGGEYVYSKLLGQGWKVDDYFLILVTIPLVIRLCVSPISTVFITHDCVTKLSIWQLGYFVSTVSVLYLASSNFSLRDFLVIFALHEMLAYSIYLFMGNLVAQRVKTC
jgi:hypothetical protein